MIESLSSQKYGCENFRNSICSLLLNQILKSRKTQKTVSTHLKGRLENGNSQKRECNTECIDTGIKELNGLYSKGYKGVHRKQLYVGAVVQECTTSTSLFSIHFRSIKSVSLLSSFSGVRLIHCPMSSEFRFTISLFSKSALQIR